MSAACLWNVLQSPNSQIAIDTYSICFIILTVLLILSSKQLGGNLEYQTRIKISYFICIVFCMINVDTYLITMATCFKNSYGIGIASYALSLALMLAILLFRLYDTFKESEIYQLNPGQISFFKISYIITTISIITGGLAYCLEINLNICLIFGVIAAILYFGLSIAGLIFFIGKFYWMKLDGNPNEFDTNGESDEILLFDATKKSIILFSIATVSTFIFVCFDFIYGIMLGEEVDINDHSIGITSCIDCVINILCLYLQWECNEKYYNKYCCCFNRCFFNINSPEKSNLPKNDHEYKQQFNTNDKFNTNDNDDLLSTDDDVNLDDGDTKRNGTIRFLRVKSDTDYDTDGDYNIKEKKFEHKHQIEMSVALQSAGGKGGNIPNNSIIPLFPAGFSDIQETMPSDGQIDDLEFKNENNYEEKEEDEEVATLVSGSVIIRSTPSVQSPNMISYDINDDEDDDDDDAVDIDTDDDTVDLDDDTSGSDENVEQMYVKNRKRAITRNGSDDDFLNDIKNDQDCNDDDGAADTEQMSVTISYKTKSTKELNDDNDDTDSDFLNDMKNNQDCNDDDDDAADMEQMSVKNDNKRKSTKELNDDNDDKNDEKDDNNNNNNNNNKQKATNGGCDNDDNNENKDDVGEVSIFKFKIRSKTKDVSNYSEGVIDINRLQQQVFVPGALYEDDDDDDDDDDGTKKHENREERISYAFV